LGEREAPRDHRGEEHPRRNTHLHRQEAMSPSSTATRKIGQKLKKKRRARGIATITSIHSAKTLLIKGDGNPTLEPEIGEGNKTKEGMIPEAGYGTRLQ